MKDTIVHRLRHSSKAHASAREAKGASAIRTALEGMAAGALGVAAMTLAEKVEQLFTKRPNSYVPAHTLERLLGLPRKADHERLVLNHVMHWGQGILLGTVRAFMARAGMQGAIPSFMFTALRLSNDQLLENATGVGAPPWTWPKDEQWVDLIHKTVYGFATGFVADRLYPDRVRRHDQ